MLAGAKADMKLAGALGEVGVEKNIVSTTGLWALELAGPSVKGEGESDLEILMRMLYGSTPRTSEARVRQAACHRSWALPDAPA